MFNYLIISCRNFPISKANFVYQDKILKVRFIDNSVFNIKPHLYAQCSERCEISTVPFQEDGSAKNANKQKARAKNQDNTEEKQNEKPSIEEFFACLKGFLDSYLVQRRKKIASRMELIKFYFMTNDLESAEKAIAISEKSPQLKMLSIFIKYGAWKIKPQKKCEKYNDHDFHSDDEGIKEPITRENCFKKTDLYSFKTDNESNQKDSSEIFELKLDDINSSDPESLCSTNSFEDDKTFHFMATDTLFNSSLLSHLSINFIKCDQCRGDDEKILKEHKIVPNSEFEFSGLRLMPDVLERLESQDFSVLSNRQSFLNEINSISAYLDYSTLVIFLLEIVDNLPANLIIQIESIVSSRKEISQLFDKKGFSKLKPSQRNKDLDLLIYFDHKVGLILEAREEYGLASIMFNKVFKLVQGLELLDIGLGLVKKIIHLNALCNLTSSQKHPIDIGRKAVSTCISKDKSYKKLNSCKNCHIIRHFRMRESVLSITNETQATTKLVNLLDDKYSLQAYEIFYLRNFRLISLSLLSYEVYISQESCNQSKSELSDCVTINHQSKPSRTAESTLSLKCHSISSLDNINTDRTIDEASTIIDDIFNNFCQYTNAPVSLEKMLPDDNSIGEKLMNPQKIITDEFNNELSDPKYGTKASHDELKHPKDLLLDNAKTSEFSHDKIMDGTLQQLSDEFDVLLTYQTDQQLNDMSKSFHSNDQEPHDTNENFRSTIFPSSVSDMDFETAPTDKKYGENKISKDINVSLDKECSYDKRSFINNNKSSCENSDEENDLIQNSQDSEDLLSFYCDDKNPETASHKSLSTLVQERNTGLHVMANNSIEATPNKDQGISNSEKVDVMESQNLKDRKECTNTPDKHQSTTKKKDFDEADDHAIFENYLDSISPSDVGPNIYAEQRSIQPDVEYEKATFFNANVKAQDNNGSFTVQSEKLNKSCFYTSAFGARSSSYETGNSIYTSNSTDDVSNRIILDKSRAFNQELSKPRAKEVEILCLDGSNRSIPSDQEIALYNRLDEENDFYKTFLRDKYKIIFKASKIFFTFNVIKHQIHCVYDEIIEVICPENMNLMGVILSGKTFIPLIPKEAKPKSPSSKSFYFKYRNTKEMQIEYLISDYEWIPVNLKFVQVEKERDIKLTNIRQTAPENEPSNTSKAIVLEFSKYFSQYCNPHEDSYKFHCLSECKIEEGSKILVKCSTTTNLLTFSHEIRKGLYEEDFLDLSLIKYKKS